jgi:hypothetical protein
MSLDGDVFVSLRETRPQRIWDGVIGRAALAPM